MFYKIAEDDFSWAGLLATTGTAGIGGFILDRYILGNKDLESNLLYAAGFGGAGALGSALWQNYAGKDKKPEKPSAPPPEVQPPVATASGKIKAAPSPSTEEAVASTVVQTGRGLAKGVRDLYKGWYNYWDKHWGDVYAKKAAKEAGERGKAPTKEEILAFREARNKRRLARKAVEAAEKRRQEGSTYVVSHLLPPTEDEIREARRARYQRMLERADDDMLNALSGTFSRDQLGK